MIKVMCSGTSPLCLTRPVLRSSGEPPGSSRVPDPDMVEGSDWMLTLGYKFLNCGGNRSSRWGGFSSPPGTEPSCCEVTVLTSTTTPSCCQKDLEQTAETIFSTWKALKLARPSGWVEEMTRHSSGVLDPPQATAALYFSFQTSVPTAS